MNQKKCIVIVDDDPISSCVNESLINQELKDIDCLIAFSDGREALKYLDDKNHSALVLLDLLMPGIDGFEFLKRYRDLPFKDNTHRIVVISNSTRIEDKERVLELGASDFLQKPNTKEKMKQLLDKHFYH